MAEKLPEWVKTSMDYERWKRGEGSLNIQAPAGATPSIKQYDYSKYICTACRSVGTPKKVTKGSFWIEIVLWLFMIVPGLIYSIWRLTTKYNACPICQNPTMIPLSSPMGKQLLEQSS
ncbi:MAG: YqaE/Pmp3 family membrane protein [Nitrospiraceae bacterium]|nr:YqaE/Pmp3 family membrane protein [Nitrospiraceae bacterium]